MPLTATGRQVLRRYRAGYGWDHGERYFWASIRAHRPGTAKWHKGVTLRKRHHVRHHRLPPRSKRTGRFMKRGSRRRR